MKIINFLVPILLVLSAIPTGFAINDEVVVIASTPADAILAAQYAKEMGYTFIYTPAGELSTEAEKAIKYANTAIMIGGPEAISENVENQLKEKVSSVERVWGADRVDTSLELLKRLVVEKPEALNNIVLAEGFNEDVTPAALNFDSPILYFAPDNYEKIAEFLNGVHIENAVVMGSTIPNEIRTAASQAAETTNLISGAAENIIETVLSVASNLNPSILNAVAALVYSEVSDDPLMNAISLYASGNVGSIVPLPSDDEDSINEIVSKVTTITSDISVSSDSSEVSSVISESASEEGATTSTISSSSSGGGSSSTTTTAQKYTVVSINGTEKVKFADISVSETDGNHVEITGEDNIILPNITLKTNMVAKSYTGSSGSVTITYEGTGSGLNLLYPIENGALTYGSDVNATFYGSSLLANKQVTAHVLTDRQEFRDAMNDLLDGNADTFITMLNDADKVTAITDSNGDADFTITPTSYGENIVIVTLGNGTIGTTATVLGFSGFEYLKYELTVSKIGYIAGTLDVDMSLNAVPSNNCRYGAVAFTKEGYLFTIDIDGTSTSNKNFDVSIVGDNNSELIIDDSELVSLDASKINNIIGAAFNPTTAGAEFRADTTPVSNCNVIISIEATTDEPIYIIGVVYDITAKKIVAMDQISETASSSP